MESVMNTSRPTKTVGMLKRVCIMLTRSLLPQKLWKYMRLPRGMNRMAAIVMELKAMAKVLPAICRTSLSPVKMSRRAVTKAAI